LLSTAVEELFMRRNSVDTAVRVAARALLAGAGTYAVLRVGYHFRRSLLLIAAAAISEVLQAEEGPAGRRANWLGLLRAER
jgi:hypothetical protein